jgi:hypothetical protein
MSISGIARFRTTPSGKVLHKMNSINDSKVKSDFRQTGRIVGLLLLVQALLAIPVFTEIGMMRSIISPAFLTEAAANAVQIRTALILTFLLGGINIAVALVALPVFRPASEPLFWLYFGLGIVGLATAVIESVVVREMLAMSINYAKPNAAAIYNSLVPAMRSEWSAAHFFNLALGHVKALLFFLILYRGRFVPRLLAGVGVVATILSTTAATTALVGVPFSYDMVAPTGLVQLAMTLWLIVMGFSASAAIGGAEGKK